MVAVCKNVPEDVSFERVGSRVSLVAQVALVLPGARVELGVRLEVPGGGEPQRALGARVRLVPGVRPPVHHQLAAAGETLAAVLARVPAYKCTSGQVERFFKVVPRLRSLSRVGSGVQAQSLLHGETLVANAALVRHLSCVGSHVDGQAVNEQGQ